MKKIITILAVLLLLQLCACGNAETQPDTPKETEPPLTVYSEIMGTIPGDFDGTVSHGEPSGEGTFTASSGWSFTGSFSGGTFAAGSVESMPITLSLAGQSVKGTYTGEVDALIPVSEGVFTDENGGTFTGTITDGTIKDGTADSLTLSASFRGKAVSGAYTGAVRNSLPEGNGTFLAEKGRLLSYSGLFTAGEPTGTAQISDSAYSIELNGKELRCTYTGAVVNAVPEGEGTLTGRTEQNVDFTYTGSFSNGLFHGQGSLIYASDLYYDRIGSFTNGVFTPDTKELLNMIGSAEPKFTVSDDTVSYLQEYPELTDGTREVPGYMESSYRLQYRGNFNYDVYKNAPGEDPTGWLLMYNYMVIDSWTDTTLGDGNDCTHLICTNSIYGNSVECLIFGHVKDLERYNSLTMFGLPLALSSYTNENGQPVETVVVLIASLSGY